MSLAMSQFTIPNGTRLQMTRKPSAPRRTYAVRVNAVSADRQGKIQAAIFDEVSVLPTS